MLGRSFFLAVVGVALFTYASHSDRSGAASATITQACSATKPGTATVTLVWPTPAAGAKATWFDISVVPEFAPEWFQGFGPLPPMWNAYALDGLPNGLTLYYRANTDYGGDVWRETSAGTLTAQCAAPAG